MTHISGVCRIDLRRSGDDPWLPDRTTSRVKQAVFAPPGADVVLVVAAGQYAPYEGVAYLRAHGGHLRTITVECDDVHTIERWVTALRTGGASW